jgi:hypothetical protein
MSLVNTLTQNLRQTYEDRLDKNEIRKSRYGAYDLFTKQTADPLGILTAQNKAAIKQSFGNSVVIPVLDDPNVTIGNVRSCTIPDMENTSQLVTLTFATYAFGFTMSPSQYFNNDVGYEADFNKKLQAYLVKYAATLDSLCLAKLTADKNQYWGSEITDIYAQSGNALQVPNADKEDFYNQTASIMELMDYYEANDVVANSAHKALISRLNAQGGGNSINESFQFGNFDFGYTNRLANGSGVTNTGYVVAPATLAIENRNDPDAIMGHQTRGGEKQWEEVEVPIVNQTMGAFYSEDCADRSALTTGTTGLKRTLVQGFEWSTDVVTVTAYNSAPTTNYKPIVKFEILDPV